MKISNRLLMLFIKIWLDSIIATQLGFYVCHCGWRCVGIFWLTKGQSISECPFHILTFPKNQWKNFTLLSAFN